MTRFLAPARRRPGDALAGRRTQWLVLLCAGVIPTSSLAQGAGTGPVNPDGSIILLREVPTRSAIEPGSGDASWVETGPNQAFADSIDLGVTVLGDDRAAEVRSSLSALDVQSARADAVNQRAAGAIIDRSLGNSGLADLGQPGGGSVGGAIQGGIDAGMGAANAGISAGLGTLGGTLSGLGSLAGGSR